MFSFRDDAEASDGPSTSECPVCWCETLDNIMVQGKCGHSLCRSCMERLLLTPYLHERPDRYVNGDSVVTAALQFCPICRNRIHLYDVVHEDTKDPVYESDNFLESPLAGSVYAGRDEVGVGSFHFPPFAESEEVEERSLPYLNLFKVDNLNRQVKNKIPIRNVTLHTPSHNLSGVLDISTVEFDSWQIYMTFSQDWRFVRRGVIIKNRRSLPEERHRFHFPLDGRWTIQASLPGCNEHQKIGISAGRYYDSIGDLHFVQIRKKSEESTVVVGNVATNGLKVWRLKTPWNWEENKYGPPAGTEWEFKSRAHRGSVTWRRETVSTTYASDEVNTIGGSSGRYYDRVTNDVPRPPLYQSDRLYGNVFCQGFKVGLASYHFESEDNIYISYEHPMTGKWPPLDNGMPVPSRVQFRNVSFPDAYTFRGQILWQEEFDTPWQKCVRWEYEIKFDKKFTCIVGGSVLSVSTTNSAPQPMSTFGRSLVYVNAAVFDHFVASSTENRDDSWVTEHGERLVGLNASEKTLSMLRGLYAMSRSGAQNPVDYNIPNLFSVSP